VTEPPQVAAADVAGLQLATGCAVSVYYHIDKKKISVGGSTFTLGL
jgi:hypothetical protein